MTEFIIDLPDESNKAGIDPADFIRKMNGKVITLYVLTNTNGLEMTVTNYGARVVSLMVPDRDGKFEDVVLGYDSLDGYLASNEKYFGATVGRVANRIAGGKFNLDGKPYQLDTNNGVNHLHGGLKGLDSSIWDAHQADGQTVELHYLSPDGEDGYPGNLDITMMFQLNDDNEFVIHFEATSDQATPVNIAHHSYFNLHGAGNGTINDHVLYINANHFTPTEDGLIPTGEVFPVTGTPMDFSEPTPIGLRVNDDFAQLKPGNGYDHNWVLNKPKNIDLFIAGRLCEPLSGRLMEIITDQPGLQFYGGSSLDGQDAGKSNKRYQSRSALCLETQHFPDSPNQPDFPDTILRPGKHYKHTVIYRFSTR